MPHEIKFWDISKRLDWFRARALTRKIFERPQIMQEMRTCFDAQWGDDPSQCRSLRMWRKILDFTPVEFAQFIPAGNPEAEEARESYPPYVALTPTERVRYMEELRQEVALA